MMGMLKSVKNLFKFLIHFLFLDYIDDGDFDTNGNQQPTQGTNNSQPYVAPSKKKSQMKKEEDMNSSFENECAIY